MTREEAIEFFYSAGNVVESVENEDFSSDPDFIMIYTVAELTDEAVEAINAIEPSFVGEISWSYPFDGDPREFIFDRQTFDTDYLLFALLDDCYNGWEEDYKEEEFQAMADAFQYFMSRVVSEAESMISEFEASCYKMLGINGCDYDPIEDIGNFYYDMRPVIVKFPYEFEGGKFAVMIADYPNGDGEPTLAGPERKVFKTKEEALEWVHSEENWPSGEQPNYFRIIKTIIDNLSLEYNGFLPPEDEDEEE